MALETIDNRNTIHAQDMEEMTRTEIISYNNGSWDSSKAFAADYRLYPCVRTYKANVTLGQTSETLLNTIPMIDSMTLFSNFTRTPIPCLINGVYYNASSFTTRSDKNQLAMTGLLENNQTAFVPPQCSFQYVAQGTSHYLIDLLAGIMLAGVNGFVAEPEWIAQLWNTDPHTPLLNTSFPHIEAVWTAIAESLTLNLRMNGQEDWQSPAIGTAFRNETCIIVQWPWLAYPAFLLLLTLIFLTATIVNSRRRTRHQIWKASPLALLLHGVEDDLKEGHKHEIRTSEMEKSARKMDVRIGR